jgi:hypothetical protein
MKRDMELIRKILLAIEAKYINVAIYNIEVEDFDFETIAYHCKIIHDAGLISDYDQSVTLGEGLIEFGVGSLTWEGHEFLDKIRDDTVWGKTKETMKDKGIPFGLDAVKQISSAIVGVMIQAAIKQLTP